MECFFILRGLLPPGIGNRRFWQVNMPALFNKICFRYCQPANHTRRMVGYGYREEAADQQGRIYRSVLSDRFASGLFSRCPGRRVLIQLCVWQSTPTTDRQGQ